MPPGRAIWGLFEITSVKALNASFSGSHEESSKSSLFKGILMFFNCIVSIVGSWLIFKMLLNTHVKVLLIQICCILISGYKGIYYLEPKMNGNIIQS